MKSNRYRVIKIIGVIAVLILLRGCNTYRNKSLQVDNSSTQNQDIQLESAENEENIEDSITTENTTQENLEDSDVVVETIKDEFTSLQDAKKMSANSIVEVNTNIMEDLFYSEEIDEDLFNRIYGKSYKEYCDVPLEELRYIRVLFYGFDGKTHIGELIVNKKIETSILEIFSELYNNKYEIESMVLIDDFDADDESSMNSNNTSAFNYRTIAGSSTVSNHSYGMAIDINPLYNPYVKITDSKTLVSPASAMEYVDRQKDFSHKVDEDDLCMQLFKQYGFKWGGDYNSIKDYQHFEYVESN